jgi:hypothetical protein
LISINFGELLIQKKHKAEQLVNIWEKNPSQYDLINETTFSHRPKYKRQIFNQAIKLYGTGWIKRGVTQFAGFKVKEENLLSVKFSIWVDVTN